MTKADRLWSYLSPGAEDVLEALGYQAFPNEAVNPIWEALAGLSPLSHQEIEELVDAGELAPGEAEQYWLVQERGRGLADRLTPLIWTGKKANKKSIMLAYVLAQTNALNHLGGSIGTGDLASIRQRWYASKSHRAMGFKFAAQALERYLVQSADVVLVDDQRAMDQAKRIGAENVIYKCVSHGIHLKLNNRAENNVIVDLIEATHKGKKVPVCFFRLREGPMTGGAIRRNVLYGTGSRGRFFDQGENPRLPAAWAKEGDTDYNIYYCAGNRQLAQKELEKAQRDGVDAHSLAVDPLFVDPQNGDFTFKPGSPALKRGFRPIDMKKIGLLKE